MGDRVVEPSEIFVEGRGETREDVTRVNPWLRFLGRFFDYAIFFLLLWGLRQLLQGRFPLGQFEHLIPFEYFVWIPIEALLFWSLGTTPGKWLVGTRLQWRGRKKPEYTTALRRSFSVWFRGLGMMLPFLNILCLFTAYHKLKVFKMTSWDRDDQVLVTHRSIPHWRIGVAAAVILGSLLFYYSEKNKAIAQEKWKSHSTRR